LSGVHHPGVNHQFYPQLGTNFGSLTSEVNDGKLKVYQTIVHYLKYMSKMSWYIANPDKVSKKTLSNKLVALKRLLNHMKETSIKAKTRI
jgi:hypothetical protein